MSNYDPQVIIDLIRKVGLREKSEHIESLEFSPKSGADWTISVYEHEDGTRLVYVLGYLEDIQTPDIEVEVCVQTGICGYIESVRFGNYYEASDHEYPLTEGERWAKR